jgi:hypothetical protein
MILRSYRPGYCCHVPQLTNPGSSHAVQVLGNSVLSTQSAGTDRQSRGFQANSEPRDCCLLSKLAKVRKVSRRPTHVCHPRGLRGSGQQLRLKITATLLLLSAFPGWIILAGSCFREPPCMAGRGEGLRYAIAAQAAQLMRLRGPGPAHRGPLSPLARWGIAVARLRLRAREGARLRP